MKPDPDIRKALETIGQLWPEGEIVVKVLEADGKILSTWIWDRKERKPIRRGQQ